MLKYAVSAFLCFVDLVGTNRITLISAIFW